MPFWISIFFNSPYHLRFLQPAIHPPSPPPPQCSSVTNFCHRQCSGIFSTSRCPRTQITLEYWDRKTVIVRRLNPSVQILRKVKVVFLGSQVSILAFLPTWHSLLLIPHHSDPLLRPSSKSEWRSARSKRAAASMKSEFHVHSPAFWKFYGCDLIFAVISSTTKDEANCYKVKEP